MGERRVSDDVLIDVAAVVPTLRREEAWPEDAVAAFLSGSLVRGWGNRTSDLDVMVVSAQPYENSSGERSHVVLQPATLGSQRIHADGRRWDIQYWSQGQIDQLLDKVSRDSYRDPEAPWASAGDPEIEMLERLPYALAVEGEEWLEGVRAQLAGSAHRQVLIGRSLRQAGNFSEDAAGQLENGDAHSAVLAARLAFGHTVDAVQAGLGQFGGMWPKWRARRMTLVDSSALSFEQYWEVETMRTFREDDPAAWINSTLLLCRRLAGELEL